MTNVKLELNGFGNYPENRYDRLFCILFHVISY